MEKGQVTSEAQLDGILAESGNKLVVCMCKSTHCRPCQKFLPTYLELQDRFSDAVLLQVTGDSSPDMRKLMRKWEVKTTPTFRLYRGGELVETLSGTRDNKLLKALLGQLQPGEAGQEWTEVTHEDADFVN